MTTTNNADIKRILVIRMGHIGEVLLVTPALGLLHELFPQAEISVLLRTGTESMLQNHPLVKQIHTGGRITSNQNMRHRSRASVRKRLEQVPAGLKLIGELRRRQFDLVVDFSGGDRGLLYSFFSGAPERIGFAKPKRGFFAKHWLYTFAHLESGVIHKVLKDARLLYHFAVATSRTTVPEHEWKPGPLVLNPSSPDLEWAGNRWSAVATATGPRVVVHPTSRVLYKCWAPSKWAEVIARLQTEFDAAVIITSGPDPKELQVAKAVIEACARPVQAQLGDISLGQLAALIREADLFLGVDTAPMHIAAGVGTRVIAVFGPSRHEIWAPWGPGHTVVRRPCDCLDSGRPGCDEGQGMNCLNSLTSEDVFDAARKALEPHGATTRRHGFKPGAKT